ncbi:hypothetical protein [Curtobacterium sp. 24E2]|nr:hypothetical protein JN350_05340 [Curtobacterium sp. 24E2]
MKTITDPTNRRTRSLLASAALAVVLLPGLLAGCSSSDAGEATSPTTGSARQGAALTDCMRGKGYDMPVSPSSGGTVNLSTPDGVDPDQYKSDLTACLGDGKGAGSAEQAKPIEGFAEKMQAAAKCIREGGFSDYPDDEERQRSYQPDDAAAFDEVAKKCDEEAIGSDVTGIGQ